MATILVDYENVYASNGLKGVDSLREDDTLIVFFSDSCRKIKSEYMQYIYSSRCSFRIVKLKRSGKNALDFYIATECGALGALGEKQIAIISNDKGFQAVLDYFEENVSMSDIHIVKAGSLENAFILLDTPQNADRRELLKQKACLLDIAEEFTRIEERENLRMRLKDAIRDTEYESRFPEIIDLIESKKIFGNKNLYTSALHSFGKTAGTDIYRLVKKIV